MNCWVFKPSSRRRPLNDSMKVFSTGFILPAPGRGGDQCHTLARELIKHRQHAERASIDQPVVHEVHAPALLRRGRARRGHTRSTGQLLPPFRAHGQAFLAIHPPHPFRIHPPALSSQQHGQTPISKPDPHGRQLPEPPTQGELVVATGHIP